MELNIEYLVVVMESSGGDDHGEKSSPAGEPSLPTGVLVQLRSWLEDSDDRPNGLPPPM